MVMLKNSELPMISLYLSMFVIDTAWPELKYSPIDGVIYHFLDRLQHAF